MNAVAFDTLKFVMKLEKSGMSLDQAKTMSEVLQDIHVEAELATKADIKALELVTKADIKALELSTKADIKALELDIKSLELATKTDLKELRLEIKDVQREMNSKISVMQWMLGVLMTGTGALVTKIFFLS